MPHTQQPRLFLLDAYALIYRAYYALIRSPRVTSSGFNTSAIFGFCNTLDELLRKEDPSHIAVCFDPPHGATFRHEAFEAYKANREKQPEDITAAIPYIKRILEAYRIRMVECEGYEADDVIGTLSREASEQGFFTYMMTPDKDYAQLVNENVVQYRPNSKGGGFELRGPAEVCEVFGVSSPLQVIDLLALEGDKVDNIPGCPGVGEKTAVQLIARYGSVENLIEHVSELKGALKTKIESNVQQILDSKFLATICTSVPLPDGVCPGCFTREKPDYDKLREIYKELEFNTMLKRLPATSEAEVEKPVAAPVDDFGMGSLFDLPAAADVSAATDITFETVASDDMAKLREIVDETLRCEAVGVCLAATGDEAVSARIKGVALALSADRLYFVEYSPEAAEVLRPLLCASDRKTVITGHDLKRDYVTLRAAGIEMTEPWFDTSVAHYLINPEKKHQLPQLTLFYLHANYSPDNEEGNKDEKRPVTPMQSVRRARASLMLRKPLADALAAEGEQIVKLFEEVELPLIQVLAEMEFTGVKIDTEALAVLSSEMTARINLIERKIYEMAGCTFNLSSPSQVGEVLFEKLKIDENAKRTKKTGSYSTTEEILSRYASRYPIVDLILKQRGLRKLLSTYINALPALINPATGKIHTTYNQTVTATGRISSTNPNLQNIPVRSDDGRGIRRAFVSDPGDLFMSCDYSQIELRLMADLSGDPDMVEAFRHGEDIHRATAAKIYHLPLDEVSDDMRRKAKTANFGIIYGISAFGLSERLSIPRAEAKMLIDGYFRSYPHISEYIRNSIGTAREKGYATTVMGRRRMLPDINSRNATVRAYAERNAVNAPIQGSAADIIKVAMVAIFRRMKELNLKSRMIMQVHDELIFNVKPEELPMLQPMVLEEMSKAYSGKVSLEVSSGIATNWLDAH